MSWVLKSPTIIVLLSISPFMSVSVCLVYCGAPMLGASVQFSLVVQSCLTLCDPMDCSMPGPLCPSQTPGVYSNFSPLSWWCHPTISSSLIPFSCLQSFPASRSFPMSQFFASVGQSIGVSASASVLSMNIQNWLPLELTDWISLQSKELSRVFSSTTIWKHQFLWSNSHNRIKY